MFKRKVLNRMIYEINNQINEKKHLIKRLKTAPSLKVAAQIGQSELGCPHFYDYYEQPCDQDCYSCWLDALMTEEEQTGWKMKTVKR